MTNKESLRDAMDRRLSFLDGRPSCRARVQQRIAQEEEPEMKRKISVGLIFAMVLVSLSVFALAAGLLFSPKADAARLADAALEEKYGVTPEMQTYFVRSEEDIGGGAVRVTYAAEGELAWVLGTYTADVKDGRAEVSWSRDGAETAGGYAADAWGAEQLKQMIKDNTETGDMGLFIGYAAEAAKRAGVAETETGTEKLSEEEIRAYFDSLEAEKTQALRERVLSEEEMRETAKDAIAESYGLTAEQKAALELYVQPLAEEENAWYWMIGGEPCFEAQYFLEQNPGTFTEKDGAYAVAVNVKTGVIERIVYESGLGGEG